MITQTVKHNGMTITLRAWCRALEIQRLTYRALLCEKDEAIRIAVEEEDQGIMKHLLSGGAQTPEALQEALWDSNPLTNLNQNHLAEFMPVAVSIVEATGLPNDLRLEMGDGWSGDNLKRLYYEVFLPDDNGLWDKLLEVVNAMRRPTANVIQLPLSELSEAQKNDPK